MGRNHMKKLLFFCLFFGAVFGATNARVYILDTSTNGTNRLNSMIGTSSNFVFSTNSERVSSNFLTGKIDSCSNSFDLRVTAATNDDYIGNSNVSNYALIQSSNASNYSFVQLTNLQTNILLCNYANMAYEVYPTGFFYPARHYRGNTAIASTSNTINLVYWTHPITETYSKVLLFCTAVMTTQTAVTNARSCTIAIYEVTNTVNPAHAGYYTNLRLIGTTSNMATNFSTTANQWKLGGFTNSGGAITLTAGKRYALGFMVIAQPTAAVYPSVATFTVGGGNVAFWTGSFPPACAQQSATAGIAETLTPSTMGLLTPPMFWLSK